MNRYKVQIKSIGVGNVSYYYEGAASRITIAVKRAVDAFLDGKVKTSYERAGIEIKAFRHD